MTTEGRSPGAASEDARSRLARRLAEQGRACAELGSPLYAGMMARAAADALAGGPVAQVLAGHENDPAPSALALRLFGAVHRLVLLRQAPGLALHYPSVGGDGDPDAAWPAFLEVLSSYAGEIRPLLHQPPQTNEVGRSAALLGGLLHVCRASPLPVRLVEIGASAGLSLRADRFRFEAGGGAAWGDAASPVVLADAWRGSLPPLDAPLRVVSRLGTDVAPVDPLTTEGRLTLTSYVWPDQRERLERLRGALRVAAEVPARLTRASARQTVEGLSLEQGTTTVVWHSVMWQYLAEAERSAVEARLNQLGTTAAPDARLAHLSLEPGLRELYDKGDYPVRLRTWPGGEERLLGTARPHGIPVTWA